MGAEVIKIESQVYIDIGRTNPAGMADRVAGVNRNGFYHALNYGKKAINLNLDLPRAANSPTISSARATSCSNVFPAPTAEKLGLT